MGIFDFGFWIFDLGFEGWHDLRAAMVVADAQQRRD
jgi:hypothetical protein